MSRIGHPVALQVSHKNEDVMINFAIHPGVQWVKLLPLAVFAYVLTSGVFHQQAIAEFRAGAAVTDVTPVDLPAIVNGGMLSRSLNVINTRLHARAIVLADDNTKIAIVVVDSCMMPRPLLDDVKASASKQTGIPTSHILISATHTHSAPSCMGALGTDADPNYIPFLKGQVVQAIKSALAQLEPAQIGFTTANAAEFTALRRWIRRPDRIALDPFNNPTVRANMHSANNWDDVTGESGPEDPALSLISIQSRDGKPLAVLANFSMHYFSDKNISADYFGLFSEGLKERIAPKSEFVGMMSHGCSGDIWRRDYRKPKGERGDDRTIVEYTNGLLDIAEPAYRKIQYQSNVELKMAEKRMTLNYRVPNLQLREWAQRIVDDMGDRPPKSKTEVYAMEQLILHERQQTEIVVQALRIGEIGIATTPNETYAITGLKIKQASPLKHNMVIELANGGDGYIPPPEQHLFGGYNTWAARSAGLEILAEPKITEACIELLEDVSNRPRKVHQQTRGSAATTIAQSKPVAWYRFDEMAGPIAVDSSGQHNDAFFEPRVTFFLKGPRSDVFCTRNEVNRAAMFVGGRVQTRLSHLADTYTVSMWIWNGMPAEGRDVAGWFFSRGNNHGLSKYGEHLGVGGKSGHTAKLIYQSGNNAAGMASGKTEIMRWSWNHVVFVRENKNVRVFLNGKLEIETHSDIKTPAGLDRFFIGGRSDNRFNWEGRIDEVAFFNRSLGFQEIQKLSVD